MKLFLALAFLALLIPAAILLLPPTSPAPAPPPPEPREVPRTDGDRVSVPAESRPEAAHPAAPEAPDGSPRPAPDSTPPAGSVAGPTAAPAGRSPVDPVEPGALVLRREQLLLGPELAGARVTVMLRPLDGSGPVLDLMFGEDGTAALPPPGLPAGLYEAEVAAVKDGVLVRVKQQLRVGEGSADLDGVEIEPGAGVRARVVDEDEAPIPQTAVVVVRPEEEPGQGRRVPPGEGGWVTFADLEPGVDHRLVVFGLPEPLERVVRVPPRAKAVAEVEIRWPARLVPVTLALTDEDGATVEATSVTLRVPATGHEWTSPLPIPGGLVPGDYEVRIGDLSGRLSVPAVEALETTLPLTRGR